jgi:ABC-type transport system involved in multi-copper enzyme maturation permease subunit
MLWKIAGFEFRFQLLSPASIAIFAIFFLLVFGGVTIDQIQVGGGGAVNINSPNALTTNLLIFSIFGAIIPTVFLSSGVLRDFNFKTSELFYSRPVREFDFVLGRFIGVFLITACVYASVPLAFFLGSLMPWLDPELVGPTVLWHYPYLFLLFGVVNMWVVGTILFTVSNLTRSTVMTYAAFVGLLVLYFVGLGLAGTQPEWRETIALIDPFAFNTFVEATRYWTVFEQNSQVTPLEGDFLTNRVIWIGVGAALLALNVAVFRFRQGGGIKLGGRKGAAAGPSAPAITDIDLPKATPNLDGGAARAQFFSRVSFEVKGVVFNVAFWILLVLGLLNTVPGFFLGNEFYGTPNYPLTRTYINIINGVFAWLPFVVVIYYAAEVMWRERRFGFSFIVDATPTPSWVFIASKFIALCLVVTSLIAVALIAAAASQAIAGFDRIELDQYVIRGLVEMIIPAMIFAALAMFAQVLMNNRWLGMAFMIVFMITNLIMNNLGLDHNLYQYGGNPGTPYTDMNGYGHFLGINAWFTVYWGFWALLLLILSYQLWSRGALTPITKRLAALGRTYTPGTVLLTLIAVGGAAGTGSWIFYNTNVLNEYVSGNDQSAETAAYEREWIHLLDEPNAKITDVDVEVDIYPHERRYDVRGHYMVENRTDAPLETVWVTYGPATTLHAQSLEGAELETEDDRFNTYGFSLDTPMQPGESRRLDFTVSNENPGFRNAGNNSSVRDNGTFFNNGAVFPILGFNTQRRLFDRQSRRRQGLEPIERAFDLEDESRWNVNYIRQDSDYVNFRAIVSTVPEQIAVAPGYLQREWEEEGRRYFEYEMDAPILNFVSFFSAEFEVLAGDRRRAAPGLLSRAARLECGAHALRRGTLHRVFLGEFQPLPVPPVPDVRIPGLRQLRAVLPEHDRLFGKHRLHHRPQRSVGYRPGLLCDGARSGPPMVGAPGDVGQHPGRHADRGDAGAIRRDDADAGRVRS